MIEPKVIIPYTEAPKNLVAKIAEACNAVGGVAKQGRNQLQNYDYVRAADVAKVFRHELFERGVIIVADEQELTQREFVTAKGSNMIEVRLKMAYNVTDGVSTLTFGAFGIAMDSGDKAIWKAKTGALKYFLRGLGIVPDEKDDPEADESVDKAVGAPAIKTPQPLRKETPQKDSISGKCNWCGEIHIGGPEGCAATERKAAVLTKPDDMPANDPPKKREFVQLPGKISQKQAARIFAIGKGRQLDNAAILAHIASHGFENTNEIPFGEVYNRICAELEVM